MFNNEDEQSRVSPSRLAALAQSGLLGVNNQEQNNAEAEAEGSWAEKEDLEPEKKRQKLDD